MSENLNSNNMENDITNLKYVEIDYRNLINKLREIKKENLKEKDFLVVGENGLVLKILSKPFCR